MKWVEHYIAEGYMRHVHALWETSFHYVNDEGAYARFLHGARLSELQVPDDSNHEHPDFERAVTSVEKLIAMLKSSQITPAKGQEQTNGSKRAPGEDVLELDAPAAAKRNKRLKKIDDTARDKGEDYNEHYKRLVSKRTEQMVWTPDLLNSDGTISKRQYQGFIKEFFFQQVKVKNISPPRPGNRNEFNVILKDTVREFMEVFRHAPPWELVYAFLKGTTCENGPVIWQEWCKREDCLIPKGKELKGNNEKGRGEFRWELWKTAHRCAIKKNMDPETAAKAGALAEAFGLTEAATELCNLYASSSTTWSSIVREKAAEFAEQAWAIKATASAAAAAELLTDASAADSDNSTTDLNGAAGGGGDTEPDAVASNRRPLSDSAATVLTANASASAAGASPSSLGSVSGGEL